MTSTATDAPTSWRAATRPPAGLRDPVSKRRPRPGPDPDRPASSAHYNTNQVVQSSPAIGQFLGGGAYGIAVGHRDLLAGASHTNQLLGLGPDATWRGPAPSTADQQQPGPGRRPRQRATPDRRGHQQRRRLRLRIVWLLNGATGAPIWHVPVVGAVDRGDRQRRPGRRLPGPHGAHDQAVWRSSTGAPAACSPRPSLPHGHAELGAGHRRPQRRDRDHDRRLQRRQPGRGRPLRGAGHPGQPGQRGWGVADVPPRPATDGQRRHAPPVVAVPCQAPPTPPRGLLPGGASDGGIFRFGNLPYCGSTGNVASTARSSAWPRPPTVAATGWWRPTAGSSPSATPGSTGPPAPSTSTSPSSAWPPTPRPGYWLVAADGGIFSFGDARSTGPPAPSTSTSPSSAWPPPPTARATGWSPRDGGIFTFGDARFHGSTGAIHLNQPIVGMAATPDGQGYWLVARDGGIFTFGTARFHGSTGAVHLSRPIIGMVVGPGDRRLLAGGGRWRSLRLRRPLLRVDRWRTAGPTHHGDRRFLRGQVGIIPVHGRPR